VLGRHEQRKILLFCSLAAVVAYAGCQGILWGAAQCPLPPPNLNGSFENSVNHIIFMMQENRSFDAYSGKLNHYRSTAFLIRRDTDDLESAFTNLADDCTPVRNFYLDTGCIFDTTAAWQQSWGDMNRFTSPNGPFAPGWICSHRGPTRGDRQRSR
jgi:hypothetical protein